MTFKAFLIISFWVAICYGQNETTIDSISQSNFTLNTVVLDSETNTSFTKNVVLGKFNYKNHELFTKLNPSHTSKTIYLNKAVYLDFLRMYDHAKADGISLKIISGTRNFVEQKAIWERKWKKYDNLKPIDRAKKILKYSSMPSTSRHHWGTDIDLNSFTNSYFDKGQGKNEYTWLLKNANSYGFYQVYTNKSTGRTGYNLERWHWSYIPLASKYLSFYNKHVDHADILDFKGCELAEELHIILNYVNGISEKAKHVRPSEK